MENRYFTELTRRLNESGIPTGALTDSKLPILLNRREIGVAVLGGGMLVRKDSLDKSGAGKKRWEA